MYLGITTAQLSGEIFKVEFPGAPVRGMATRDYRRRFIFGPIFGAAVRIKYIRDPPSLRMCRGIPQYLASAFPKYFLPIYIGVYAPDYVVFFTPAILELNR